MWRVASVAAISILCAVARVTAGEMAPPRITRVDVDWASATAQLGTLAVARAIGATTEAPAPGSMLDELNAAVAARLPGIAQSPVPVLLPFDVDAFLGDRAQAGPAGLAPNSAEIGQARPPAPPANPSAIKAAATKPVAIKPVTIKLAQIKLAEIDPSRDPGPNRDPGYFFGFGAPAFFAPGPSGFDATFRFSLASIPELADIRMADTAVIAISGSQLIYDLDPPPPDQGASVPALEADFPGIRRTLVEDYVRYTFVRYGVPYVVSTDCFDASAGRFHHMACRDADRVIQVFLHKLRIAGGMPPAAPQPVTPPAPERPSAASPTFTYYAPGHLIPGTGYRGNGGRSDNTVYSNIRFPIAEAPAFANTQVYANRVAGGVHTYPWRDNFCESRWFHMTQCPGGMGHQGQDIGAANCNAASLGDDRCTEHQNDVVAVRDGAILRAPGQEAVWLFVNTANEHIRFRYLHMRPKLLDADGVLSGRRVKAGEVLGQVGNFDGHENGTSYHVHFDIQVPTRAGWIYVNPYMTLVSAYERLIGGRGAQVPDEMIASATITLNDAGPAGPMTIAAIRHAILGPAAERALPADTAWRPHWRPHVTASPCGWGAPPRRRGALPHATGMHQ
jgi:hypothetical protein